MSFLLDAHTHTIASGHAYSTMQEMISAAAKKGLKLLGITEHTPAMLGTCDAFYFRNFRVIPRQQKGLRLMLGAELNILDSKGTLDLGQEILETLDLAIASLHSPCIAPASKSENTLACIRAMENPKVTILGHSDDGRYELDYEEIVLAAKENRCLLEVNNNSLNPKGFRMNSRENLKEMLDLCVKHKVSVIADSDAHIEFDVGNFLYVTDFLEELGFPQSLVVNHSVETFLSFVK